jgi:hypothetical protein
VSLGTCVLWYAWQQPVGVRFTMRDRAITMEAVYRIISQVDGTFAIERTEPGKAPVVTRHFKTEKQARAHVANLKRLPPRTD